MKHIIVKMITMLVILSPLSCYNGLNDMLDDLTMKVPICVDGVHGNDSNDGRGWANAVSTLVQALVLADAGDEIWVAGNFNISAGNDITINKSVYIYGGFSGIEKKLNERNIDSKTVIIGTSNTFNIQSNGVVIDGFSIKDKTLGISIRVTGESYSATLQNCTFSNNTAASVYINAGTLYIYDSSFSNNTQNRAIVMDGGKIITKNTDFIGNNAGTTNAHGGAIYCSTGNIKITGGSINSNSTSDAHGGSIYCINSSIEITGATFYNNSSGGNRQGGAIYSDWSLLKITGCVFNANQVKSTSGHSGGAICSINNNKLEVVGTDFISNKSNTGNGGGIYSMASELIVKNSVFYGNISGSLGGAIYILGEDSSGSPFILVNSSFSNNESKDPGFFGGGIYCLSNSDSPDLFVSNCTFYNNLANSATNAGCFYMADAAITAHFYNTLFYQNSGNYSIDGGTANFYNNAWDKGENSIGDPVNTQLLTPSPSPFISTVYGNADFLKLSSGSVCVDEGTDNISIPGFIMPSTDLAGNPRKVGTIDIGCYERQ